jgi:Flp pilus assembly protein TadG
MHRQRRARGQSLIEFALTLPILILILLGILDLGRAFSAHIVITNAARNGAYYGSMHANETSAIIQRVVTEANGSGTTITAADVSVSTTGVVGSPMRVTVTHDFVLLTAFLPGLSTLHLTGKAEMMILR